MSAGSSARGSARSTTAADTRPCFRVSAGQTAGQSAALLGSFKRHKRSGGGSALVRVSDGPPRPIRSLGARGDSQWEAVIGAPAAREAAAAVSAASSFRQCARTRPEITRLDIQNKRPGTCQ